MNLFISTDITDLSELKNSLKLAAINEWEAAHQIAQKKEGNAAYDRIHALLHRIEGDSFNARYWYNRIGEPMPKCSFEEEIENLEKQIEEAILGLE